MNKHFTSETARLARRVATERDKGMKLLVYMRPMGKKQLITGVFRGIEINIVGHNNSDCLRQLFEEITKKL